MLLQEPRKSTPVLIVIEGHNKKKNKADKFRFARQMQTVMGSHIPHKQENCRSPDDLAGWAAVIVFFYFLGKGKSSAVLPALKCCLFLKGITFKTLIAYNIIVIRVCIISNIIIKSIKKP